MHKPVGEWIPGVLLYALLAVTACVYWPGLSGIFLLDDIPNLSPLGEYPALEPWDRAVLFLESGVSGLLGRPLSLLSFLIHDTYWPTAARPFLRTNVLLHLINGCLIFWLVYLLARTQRDWPSLTVRALPVLVTGLWLLHPLNVSTVLYVVQRMTELASLFMLIGLVLYTKGRMLLAANKRLAYSLMTAGMILGLGLGVLSKETAVVLPIYVLVIEFAVLRSLNSNVSALPARTWMGVFVCLPLLAVAAWHVLYFERIMKSYSIRPFSIGERLLTEPRVLLDYIGNVVIPRRAGTGLFHDDFVVSTSFFEPVSTVLAIAVLAGGLLLGFAGRRKMPVLSFSIFWFVGGHLLEAGVVSIELYFEHRNYLPMLGPLFGLAYGFAHLLGTRAKLPTAAAVTMLIAMTGVAAWQNSTLFGQPVLAAETWAEEHPGSQRAQQFSANMWSLIGDFERAKERIFGIIAEDPAATSPHIIQYQLACLADEPFDETVLPDTLVSLRSGRYDTAAPDALQKLLTIKGKGGCPGLKYDHLAMMVDSLQENSKVNWGRARRNLLVVEAQIMANRGDLSTAAALVNRALKSEVNTKLSIFYAHLLASTGQYDKALQALDEAAARQQGRVPLSLKSLDARIDYAKRNILRRKEQAQDPS